jgi:hypothetical protein
VIERLFRLRDKAKDHRSLKWRRDASRGTAVQLEKSGVRPRAFTNEIILMCLRLLCLILAVTDITAGTGLETENSLAL